MTSSRLLSAVFLLLVCAGSAWSQALQLPFTSCSAASTSYNASQRIHVSAVYGQLVTHTPDGVQQRFLNFTIVGNTSIPILGFYNETDRLSTMFIDTNALSFDVYDYTTFFCLNLRPQTPLPYTITPPDNSSQWTAPTATYCPIDPGPLAFSASVPLQHSYQFTTLSTQIRVVDTSYPPNELACIVVNTSPMPDPQASRERFGLLQVIFWSSVGLTIAYWAVIGLARISAAWRRGGGRRGGIGWSDIKWAGTVLASAISGERLAASPALLRFCTPSARDIIFHTQWSFALGLVAVSWPQFTYPMFANVAWASLIYNVTLTQGQGSDKHWDPLTSPMLNLPPGDGFGDQINDPTSPLYLDLDAPNYLLTFPPNTANGIPSVAATIGIRPQDMFGLCLGLFLIILGSVIVISVLIWGVSWLATIATGRKRISSFFPGTRSPTFSGPLDMPKEFPELDGARSDGDMPSNTGHSNHGHGIRAGGARKSWWTYRLGQGSFHGSVLHGNLVRLLLLFHLPITIFSVYQLTLDRSITPMGTTVLAALSFAIISVIIPTLLLVRIASISTPKLYDATRTLLAFGPLYNVYIQKSQLFACVPLISSLLTGIAIGAAQKSAIAQAIIILVIEVSTALATASWLPWGKGAQMGIISFMFVVGRIATAVMLVILTPTVSLGPAACGWVAVAVLIIQGLIYVQFFLMLIMKILEGIVRLVTGVSFDRSAHIYDSGLVGAIGLGCFPNRWKRSHRKRRSQAGLSDASASNSAQAMLAPSPSVSPSYAPVATTPIAAPRSYLSPEHASRPYQETLDDDAGYSIMRAWQPFPQYTPVNISPGNSNTSHERVDQTPPPQPVAPPPQTGFSRVRGGRATFETPYSMVPQQQQQMPGRIPAPIQPPSPGRPLPPPAGAMQPPSPGQPTTAAGRPASPGRAGRPPSPGARSALAAARAAAIPRTSPSLPPSAWPAQVATEETSPLAPRLHVRTKSQTAVIEDASLLAELQQPPVAGPSRIVTPSSSRVPAPSAQQATPAIAVTEPEESASKRKRRWFNRLSQPGNAQISDDEYDGSGAVSPSEVPEKPRGWFRRNRRRSEGDVLSPRHTLDQQQQQQQQDNSKSFVVMRPLRPSPTASAGGTVNNNNNALEYGTPTRPSMGDDLRRPSTSSSLGFSPPLPRKSSKRRPSSSGN